MQYTLEPLVYVGPAEGSPKEQWKLRSAKELLALKICDMACGSGAFLVQACRYMAARLLEAWDAVQRANPGSVRITPEGQPSTGQPGEMLIPVDPDERQTYAFRIVAQRCLYGVDKNPLAAEMAKLSLWLLTLAKDKPFEFLDHAIRCGDSLIGIHDLKQLEHLTISGEKQFAPVFLESLQSSIREAVRLRKQLIESPGNDPQQVEAQEALFCQATDLTAKLGAAADLMMADIFNKEQKGVVIVAAKFRNTTAEELQKEANKELGNRLTFHWPLEFPEVIQERGGFDAFVGNPPFMGGQKITGALGEAYRHNLVVSLANGKRGSADLCGYFFLRAWELLRKSGNFGFLATNTIAQGDTREVGLDQLVADGAVIYRASPSRAWPGSAGVFVAICHLHSGNWLSCCNLDDVDVPAISPFLDAEQRLVDPYRLASNVDRSFMGSQVHGMGFVLTSEEAQALIANDSRNRNVVRPYLDGATVNKRPDQSAERWVIDFTGLSESDAASYSACYDILVKRAKSDRMALAGRNASVNTRVKLWWRFSREVKALYNMIRDWKRVLVIARVSRTGAFVYVSPDQVLNDKLIVFTISQAWGFSVLQSTFHLNWCWTYSSTLKGDLNYSQTDCFETFPLPNPEDKLSCIGENYHEHRRQIMLARQEGLTKTYNRFHKPDETSNDIQKLRQLHLEMDHAVAAAYGWTNLDLGHGFHQTKQGLRYTISELARREVLGRLLKLNHERFAEEVAKGLHDSKAKRAAAGGKQKSKKTKTKPTSATVGRSLFDMDGVDTAFPGTDWDRLLCGLLCDLVVGRPGLPSDAYLDALIIVLRHQRHKKLLIGGERTQFTFQAEKMLSSKGQTDVSIPWTDLLDLLTRQEAISRSSATALDLGARYNEVRSLYPACDPMLIQLVHTAAATLRELQRPDLATSTDNQEVLSAFNEDKRSLCGATS